MYQPKLVSSKQQIETADGTLIISLCGRKQEHQVNKSNHGNAAVDCKLRCVLERN